MLPRLLRVSGVALCQWGLVVSLQAVCGGAGYVTHISAQFTFSGARLRHPTSHKQLAHFSSQHCGTEPTEQGCLASMLAGPFLTSGTHHVPARPPTCPAAARATFIGISSLAHRTRARAAMPLRPGTTKEWRTTLVRWGVWAAWGGRQPRGCAQHAFQASPFL